MGIGLRGGPPMAPSRGCAIDTDLYSSCAGSSQPNLLRLDTADQARRGDATNRPDAAPLQHMGPLAGDIRPLGPRLPSRSARLPVVPHAVGATRRSPR